MFSIVRADHVFMLSFVLILNIEHALGIVLVELWCQEIHIFHLPVGKASMTLQEVAVLLMRTDEPLVVAPIAHEWWVCMLRAVRCFARCLFT